MRKNFGAKPWTYPQPVFILATYNEDGTPNAMNAAWGGISEDKELSMCISAGHKITANILARKAFTVSMATAEQTVTMWASPPATKLRTRWQRPDGTPPSRNSWTRPSSTSCPWQWSAAW